MERFIDPAALARVKDLELVARSVANGFLHGVQASQQRGIGIEFSQYRAYEPGDAPSRIDWKLFARSDRYFVREAERESEIDIWFVLDSSHSMSLASEGGAWNKFDYARHLLATLAYLAQRQGDRIGFLGVSGSETQLLPALTGLRQWHRILHALQHSKAAGRFPDAAALGAQLNRLQGPGLVILISDLHQQAEEIEGFVRKVNTPRNETAVLQLDCGDELEFPYSGPVRFQDLETGEEVLASGRSARDAYLKGRADWQARLERGLIRHDVSLDRLNIDEPLDRALYAFLDRRRRRPAA